MFSVQKYTHLYISLVLTFLGIFCLCAGTSFAHGTGVSFEEEKDGYFIDIGYSVPEPVAREALRFDFNTYATDVDSSNEEEIFTDVWVRVAQGRDLFFSGGIHKPEFGSTGFTYIFPEAGSYEVLARFQKEGETVVETSFTIEVLPSAEAQKAINPFLASGVGFLLGAIIMFFISRSKRKK